MALINQRFHLVTSRILHRRLLNISSLPQNDLILECYRPSAKISTPYLMCRYLHSMTRGSEIGANGQPPVLSDLGRMYSSFKPHVAEENRRRRQRLDGEVSDDDTAREDLFLDDGELFTQLCAVTNLVKTGPRAGLFLSHVNISDGVLRIWREWLTEVATPIREVDESLDSNKILWVDAAKTVGVRFRVTLGPMERMPVISGPNDQPPIAYKLEYEGESIPVFKSMKWLTVLQNFLFRRGSFSGRPRSVKSKRSRIQVKLLSSYRAECALLLSSSLVPLASGTHDED